MTQRYRPSRIVGGTRDGSTELLPDMRTVRAHRAIRLMPTAYDVLQRLAATPGKLVTMERIYTAVWGNRASGGPDSLESIVRVSISVIRNALREAGSDWHVETIYGAGYVLVIPEQMRAAA